ncbi:hypothetical protein [Krasilnikovia sp. M28-CT-15]|uniref:hypothetical protein n=1 Tax=Krasilnikovia sp. M28-CT-15 TaxID=3373540 RepID=UPI0038763ABB
MTLGNVVAAIVQLLGVMAKHLAEVVAQVNQQKTETNDWSNFPSSDPKSVTGHWPQAVNS